MLISVVIVNYNTAHLLGEMFAALGRAAGPHELECIVVDNASRDDSVALLRREFPQHRLIENRDNVGFGRANNQAMAFAKGEYVLLLNTDAFVAPGALDRSVAYLEAHPRCGILGVKLLGRDGRLQPSCRFFPTPWNLFLQRTGFARFFPRARLVDDLAWDHASPRACDWVPGCCYLVRRRVIDEVGLFDPRYFLYYEEVDHCRAARRAGWEVVYFPDASAVHLGGESAKSEGPVTAAGRQLEALHAESELLYFRKNHGLAGAAASVLLQTLADAGALGRRVARGSSDPGACWRHAALVWSLALRTGLGARPTR